MEEFATIQEAKSYVAEYVKGFTYLSEHGWDTLMTDREIINQEHSSYWNKKEDLKVFVAIYEFKSGAGVRIETQGISKLVIYAEMNDVVNFSKRYPNESNPKAKALAFKHAVARGSMLIIDYYYDNDLFPDFELFSSPINCAVIADNVDSLKRIMKHEGSGVEGIGLGIIFGTNAFNVLGFILQERGFKVVYSKPFLDDRAMYLLSEGAERENKTIKFWLRGYWKLMRNGEI